jgi:hypothetical protein
LVGMIPLRMVCPIHSWGWETSIQMEHSLGEAWLISLLWVCACMWCVKESKVCGIRDVINLMTSCWHGIWNRKNSMSVRARGHEPPLHIMWWKSWFNKSDHVYNFVSKLF